MKTFSLALFAFATVASAYDPSEPWDTLTPDAPPPADALTDFTSSFGISPVTITDEAVLSSASAEYSAHYPTHHPSATASSYAAKPTDPSIYFKYTSVKSSGALVLYLNNTVLTDSRGRLGAIVANRQFQFDGPPPQAGTIYAAGWSIQTDGSLTIGDNEIFFQCLSGTFYNLYDQSLGPHCHAVFLKAVSFVE